MDKHRPWHGPAREATLLGSLAATQPGPQTPQRQPRYLQVPRPPRLFLGVFARVPMFLCLSLLPGQLGLLCPQARGGLRSRERMEPFLESLKSSTEPLLLGVAAGWVCTRNCSPAHCQVVQMAPRADLALRAPGFLGTAARLTFWLKATAVWPASPA